LGGEGGEAGQHNRGGQGGRSPFEVLGIPNIKMDDGRWLWEIGKGGDGTSSAGADSSVPLHDGPHENTEKHV